MAIFVHLRAVPVNFTLAIQWKQTSLNVAFIGQKRVLEKKITLMINVAKQSTQAAYHI